MAAKRRSEGPVGAVSICDRAYNLIKRQIITNETPAGTQINDREIAERLGVSRTPIREAILLLQKEGFVEVMPRHGVRVRPIFPEDIRELFDILTALETLAVGLLAARRPALEAIGPLIEAVKAMETALKKGEFPAWIEADERFHRSLFQLAGNRRLAEAGMRYRDQVQRAHVVALKLRPTPIKSVEGHAKLIELIRRGEVEAARACHYAEWVRAGEELLAGVTRCGLKCL